MKKIITLVLASALCMSSAALAAETLNDTAPEVTAVAEAGVLRGTGTGYELDRGVTRAEALMFIQRLTGAAFNDTVYPEPSFIDIYGHWAYDVIEKFTRAGYIDGTGNNMFAPDRGITAREFLKIFMSVKNGGTGDMTIDNVYEAARSAGYLNNDEVREMAADNVQLTRSDVVRLCADVLEAENVPHDAFADKLAEEMAQNENYIISPFSIKSAFAMVANGARGDTREQILDALEIEDLDEFNEKMKSDMERYASDAAADVEISNSIWLFDDVTERDYLDTFKNTAREYYSAEEFKLPSYDALAKINGWVSEKTYGKIDRILDQDQFNEMLKSGLFSTLINTVYFKASWQNAFEPSLTQKDVFTDRDGKETETDFMFGTDVYDYYDDGKMQIIEMPYSRYEDGEPGKIDLSMYAVKGDFTYASAESALGRMTPQYIELSFPKFKQKFEMSLIDIMKGFGAVDMTDMKRADLGAMFDGEIGPDIGDNPYISFAKHKTYIDVNERETEAAAVTTVAVAGGGMASGPQPIEVKYNKPFMYIIRDNETGETLFIGEYAFAG